MMTKERLAELVAEADRLELAYHTALNSVKAAKLELCPIKVGMVVKVKQRNEYVAIIRQVDVEHGLDRPWAYAAKRLKGGGWHKGAHLIFDDYEPIQEQPA